MVINLANRFDYEKALAGAKVSTIDGRSVEWVSLVDETAHKNPTEACYHDDHRQGLRVRVNNKPEPSNFAYYHDGSSHPYDMRTEGDLIMVVELSEKEQKNRQNCLEYVTEEDYYPEWPESYSTWHTAVSHYGYSWEQHSKHGEWYLVHENGDIIRKSDTNLRLEGTTPKPKAVLWARFNGKGELVETSLLDKSDNQDWSKYNLEEKDED